MRNLLIGLALLIATSACQTTSLTRSEIGASSKSAGGWVKVATEPPTYLPAGYPADAPRGKRYGEWIVSNRSGKRFFVPAEGAGGLSEGEIRRAALRSIDRIHPGDPIGDACETAVRAGVGSMMVLGAIAGQADWSGFGSFSTGDISAPDCSGSSGMGKCASSN